MSNSEYAAFIKHKMPPSPLGRDVLLAFLFGGLICCVGQALTSLYLALGAAEDAASTLTSVSMIFLGALFTGLGLYGRLAKYAGAGTLVPITGFANSVVSPALEFKTEGLVTGLAARIFSIAGPVVVYGVGASVVYGLIYRLMQIL